MSGSLRRRIEKLEGRPGCSGLGDLPEEVLQHRLDLLLKIVVHTLTGRDATAPRRALGALRPLPLPARDRGLVDEASILERALEILRSEPKRPDYRELLAMLAAGPVNCRVGSLGRSHQ